MYTGEYEDLGSLYGSFALLAIKLASLRSRLHSVLMKPGWRGVSYSSKDRIISILKRLKRDPSVPYEGYIISEADYATNVVFLMMFWINT